ncbi:RluA family pseudouridine synthase [Candidatus Neoehrlichia procyonis]|uniref:Ribosomal large subunit pseudouridine synthase C n=1 Tax=Candidatus Neoehrlichia procyonis str. RAC413 TaxID=1359163 RepID=A0A0F3NKY1_9RICK|nr:RluA family pseudouridine synthase [Candidatus Neoehrlichia lotoris]KJV68713.1 RNA pseudouridylate synthase family protein [Candidatus Neoehrlichia lotoris str. RAC413]
MNKYIVETEDTVRLDKYIRKIISDVPQSLIEKLLRKGKILLNDKKVKANMRVKGGEVIYVSDVNHNATSSVHYENKYCSSVLQLILDNIIDENDYLIAVNKPSGIPVQGGSNVKVSINDVLHKVKNGENLRIVHRLDKDTSGVLLLARNLRASRIIAEEFRKHRVHKRYFALTYGIPHSDSGEINYPIEHKKYMGGQLIMYKKSAKTLFHIIKRFNGDVALLELQPITGRKHQLRNHLSYINCPIIGDKKNIKSSNILSNTLQLHAHFLSITLCNKEFVFTSPMPYSMQAVIDKLSIM